MKEIKLIRILRTFKPEELKDFEKFIVSPYFNKGRNLLPYFKELKKFGPGYDSPDLTKEYLFSRLNKGSRYDNKASALMNKLNSELTNLIEAYLVLTELNGEQIQKEMLLSQAAIRRGLFEAGLNNLAKAEKMLDGKGIDMEYFFSKGKLLHIKADGLEGLRNMKEYFKLTDELSLLNTMYAHISFFDEYSAINVSETEVNKKNQLIFSVTFKEKNIESVLNKLKKIKPSFADIFETYYLMYLAYSQINKRELYNSFKNKVIANLHYFKNSEKHFLLKNLSNLCTITEKRTGEKKIEEYFEIYKIMINENAYSYLDGFIDNSTFDSIVINYIMLSKFSEAEYFIKNFYEKLPKKNRDTFVNLAYARLYLETKEFKKGFKHLSKIGKDLIYDKSLKQLTITYYFELGYYEEAKTLTNSYLKFLKESKNISEIHLNRYYGFAGGINLLIDSIFNNNVGEVRIKLYEIFKKYPAAFRKNWLLKKAEELESGRAGEK